jgi:NADH:ubiquinone oxidoreductase subunit 6 (subunit J)
MIEGLTGEVLAFVVFAGIALGAAVAVVSMRNLVHGALMLVIHLLAVAGLYLTLESQFLAVVQVLVYAGAIVVLFLFVIMLLGVDRDDLLIVSDRRRVAGIVAAGLIVAGAMTAAFVGPYTGEASVCGSGVAAVGSEQPCVGLEARSRVPTTGRRRVPRTAPVHALHARVRAVRRAADRRDHRRRHPRPPPRPRPRGRGRGASGTRRSGRARAAPACSRRLRRRRRGGLTCRSAPT